MDEYLAQQSTHSVESAYADRIGEENFVSEPLPVFGNAVLPNLSSTFNIESIAKAKYKDVSKDEHSTKLAYLTHYLHSFEPKVEKYFSLQAKEFVSQLIGVVDSNEIHHVERVFKVLREDVSKIPFPPPANPKFTFIDLFAGIGGLRLAYQKSGGKCVFSSEWSASSKITYQANFGETPFGDITEISEVDIPDHDLLLAGFPCQPFSIAGVSKKNSLGKSHGFEDLTQGTLFFDIARIIKHKKPKAFMLENVKNLISHDKGNTFQIIKGVLEELGYKLTYKVLDGKHFVPQHRERIVIVGLSTDIFPEGVNFQFPVLPEPSSTIGDILEQHPNPKYTLSSHLWEYLQNYAAKHKAAGNGFGFGLTPNTSIARTLSARYYKDGSEILIPQGENENPRRLTPRECARLQGFPEDFLIPVSDTQAYRQFGNSVVVPLFTSVAKELSKLL